MPLTSDQIRAPRLPLTPPSRRGIASRGEPGAAEDPYRMADMLFLAVTAAIFLALVAFVYACERV